MEEEQEQTERIERYLNGELSAAEAERLRAALATDAELRRRVALHRELHETFGDAAYERVRRQIAEVGAQHASAKDGKPLPRRRWWAVAATVLLLAALGTFLWLRQPGPADPAALAMANFSPYPAPAFRGTAEADPALVAYRAGDFATAAERWAALPADSLTDTRRFYRAVALLGAERGAAAAPLLADLRDRRAVPGLAEPLEWYLALAYLQAGEPAAADSLLRAIVEQPDHYQRAAAARLLNR